LVCNVDRKPILGLTFNVKNLKTGGQKVTVVFESEKEIDEKK